MQVHSLILAQNGYPLPSSEPVQQQRRAVPPPRAWKSLPVPSTSAPKILPSSAYSRALHHRLCHSSSQRHLRVGVMKERRPVPLKHYLEAHRPHPHTRTNVSRTYRQTLALGIRAVATPSTSKIALTTP